MKLLLLQTRNYQKNRKKDVLWNAVGSFGYAMASVVLSFLVIRLAGTEEGGIFSFGFSTLGQQLFILAYFGIRPFHITDMARRFSFSAYLRFRKLTSGAALVFSLLILLLLHLSEGYTLHRVTILFLLCCYKICDAYADVFESELQRLGYLYLAGQSMFFRTLCSVTVLLGSLALTRSLLSACLLTVAAQGMGSWLFGYRPLQICYRRYLMETGAPIALPERIEAPLAELLKETIFLFLSTFLDFYIFSASKYVVDARLGAESSGMFNILFMPASFVYLLANFMIRPALTTMASAFSARQFSALLSGYRRLLLMVCGLIIAVSLGTAVLGKWFLQICEWLLGGQYGGMLRQSFPAFFFLMLGGGLYALANLQYYVLVIIRKQGFIFLTYLLSSAFAGITAGVLVRTMGLLGGAFHFMGMMAVLVLLFSAFLWTAVRELGKCR